MNIISLAIASIVDANTDQGLTRQFGQSSNIQTAAQIQRGRQIRSKSIFDFVGLIVNKFQQLLEIYRERTRERKAIKQLLNLNQHLQKDIGLYEYDLHKLEFGLLSLDDIGQRRIAHQLSNKSSDQSQSGKVKKSILELKSVNEDRFEYSKCC